MIVRAPLDDCDGYEFYSLNDRSAYHGGCIGHEVEVDRGPEEKQRRPIGFVKTVKPKGERFPSKPAIWIGMGWEPV